MVNLDKFISELKLNLDNITRSDLQGIIEARCITTGEDEEQILKILDNYIKDNKNGGNLKC